MKNGKKKTSTGTGKPIGKPFPIVAIGASAGGLEAVTDLFKHLPSDTGMAYIYIQHLDPTHESMLSTILSRTTRMKVVEAKDMQPIQADHVYIMPPNKDMAIADHVLRLESRKAKPAIHMPIDEFFVSLAEKQKESSIGIVLSGNAHDGTVGLKAIKLAGGLTFAQDETAKFQSMPKSAIAEGVVDLILSPKDIANELERISKQTASIRDIFKVLSDDHSVAQDEDLATIIQMVKRSTGVDFTHYKINTTRRRIIRRMLLYRLESLKDYVSYIKQHPPEINVLYQDLLINVTSFFRDPDSTEYLKKTLLPNIIKSKANEPIRVWVPACSTGEEAYSIAMLFMEILDPNMSHLPIQIFATDLSEVAITKARLGLYSPNDLVDVSPKRLQQFFTKMDGSYRIMKSIRDMCVFAPHNLFKDPPFSRIDLISCCNLLIYLDVVLQKKVIATFHYALNPNGYLMLGKSETIGTSGHLFSQVERKYKVYNKKNEAAAKEIFEMTSRLPGVEKRIEVDIKKRIPKESLIPDLEKLVDNTLLSKYTPPCVVVNGDLEILQFRGSTGLFLEPSQGKASLNLLKWARPGLALELRTTIHKSLKSNASIKRSGIEIKFQGDIRQVSIEVVPLAQENEEKLFLVLFEEIAAPAIPERKSSFAKDKLVKQLQDELTAVREDMASIVEEHEASNEELQSASEEIVSSNEELQSINEELETSKEEVESTNEELMTINAEVQVRNEQLAEAYEYSEAIFGTIGEAVVVLDESLRIKMANKAFYKMFRVKEAQAEGILIYELENRQWDIPKLRELLEDIIPRNLQYHGLEVVHNFPEIGEKVLLLNARKIVQKIHRQQLILLAIEDITEHKQAEKILADEESRFRSMADDAALMIWVSGPDKLCTFVNRTWLEYTGRTMEQEKGNGWFEGILSEDIENVRETYNHSFDDRAPFQIEFRLRRRDGEYRWVLDIGKPTYSSEGLFTGYIGSCTEIHEKKMIHEGLEQQVGDRTHDLLEMNRELERSNAELEQFAYVASHDLQEPLRKIMTFSDRLQELVQQVPDPGKIYINKISSASHRMSKLIEDLLNFSRSSRFSGKFQKIDLNKVMKDTLIDFDMTINQKKAKLTVAKLPAIEAIPFQIEQLFHNLISNALKFSKNDEPPSITVTSRQIGKHEKEKLNLKDSLIYHEIIFTDNGIGFEPEFAEQIFIIFQRLDKTQYPGTGIGLALCRKIVNNHAGALYATGKENEGASFHVILPEKQGSRNREPAV